MFIPACIWLCATSFGAFSQQLLWWAGYLFEGATQYNCSFSILLLQPWTVQSVCQQTPSWVCVKPSKPRLLTRNHILMIGSLAHTHAWRRTYKHWETHTLTDCGTAWCGSVSTLLTLTDIVFSDPWVDYIMSLCVFRNALEAQPQLNYPWGRRVAGIKSTVI